MQKKFIHNTVQKFRVCKIFKYFWKMSLMLTKATFIWLKYSKNSNIVKHYYNLK